jgi:hypothetical protein
MPLTLNCSNFIQQQNEFTQLHPMYGRTYKNCLDTRPHEIGLRSVELAVDREWYWL